MPSLSWQERDALPAVLFHSALRQTADVACNTQPAKACDLTDSVRLMLYNQTSVLMGE